MSIFQTSNNSYFNQAEWENIKSSPDTVVAKSTRSPDDSKQFILLQLTDTGNRVLSTSEVIPDFEGSESNPDINMMLDFEGFNVGSEEDIDEDTKATLQLQVGQVQALGSIEKLFYCINGGLDLFNEATNKKSESKDFKKSTNEALGNRMISLPAGTGEITLKVVKHEDPTWWEKVFSFLQSDTANELISLVGFPGITKSAVSCISGMLDTLFDDEPEVLFQSMPIKLAFNKAAREELSSGLASAHVSCLNKGIWLMARKSDYNSIIDLKPIYFTGFGIIAPDGMNEIDALREDVNPFSKMTYAIIKSKLKEVDLEKGMF